jgi:signal transduction histidine kinase
MSSSTRKPATTPTYKSNPTNRDDIVRITLVRLCVLRQRRTMPVKSGVSVGRLPAAVEATAYFVIAEALTNVAKHARAEHATVTARVEDGTLVVHVRDDGVGGAQRNGSGLTGLTDRLAALDGDLRVESPADRGTVVAATIPLPG